MKVKFDKAYDPKRVELFWYEQWTKANCFHAQDSSDKPPFCIVIPPPNVTGSLHMGHALDQTLQDILIRYKRMDGFNALWMPGTDHAGIATQNVVERRLAAQGKSRESLGRDAFIAEVWRWKEESGDAIIAQQKRLGVSCDWERSRFTMDDGLSKAVRHVFVELHAQGLIYRDNYIINWCPRCQTALSDLEVEHEDIQGKLYTIRYPFVGSTTDGIEVATTRPETLFGDVAVAVHPDDDRYRQRIGKSVALPLTDRVIPILADASVKMEFGSGAVKITPAHDFNDFETGRRHQLATPSIMDARGKMDLPNTPFHQLSVKEARKQVLEALVAGGYLLNEKAHPQSVGHCYRCKCVVEPRISQQWFVKVAELAKPAIEAVRNHKTSIIPVMWEKNYFEWMENLRDWCISRQIWWGHRIPVWYCQACATTIVQNETPERCTQCGKQQLQQDPDVLDTWFSSALWPFSTLGWPQKTAALKTFYPTQVLVTGFDILFFWVARMMMMGLRFMGEVPFAQVCMHALVRDAEGQKMSKSRGNVIDPLLVMDEHGTDALRFTLAALAVPGRDILLSEDRIRGYRHFVNKLWNATRFVAMSIDNLEEQLSATGKTLDLPQALKMLRNSNNAQLSAADLWIRSLLSKTVVDVRQAYDEFRFHDAANTLYQFTWHQYCDWYIEMSKSQLDIAKGSERATFTAANLIDVLDTTLRLLHPIMPFVTEEIWQKLMTMIGEQNDEFLMLARFPAATVPTKDGNEIEEVELLKKVVTTIRTLKAENTIAPGKAVEVLLSNANDKQRAMLERQWLNLHGLAKVDATSSNALWATAAQVKALSGPVASAVIEGIEVLIPLGKLIDVDKEKSRLGKELSRVEKEISRLQGKLSNQEFVRNAPAEVVEEQRLRLAAHQDELKSLHAFLSRLERHA